MPSTKPSKINRKEPMPQMAANMATILSLLVCGFIKNYLQPGYMARKNTLVGRVKQPFSVVFIRNKIYGNYFLLWLARRQIYPVNCFYLIFLVFLSMLSMV